MDKLQTLIAHAMRRADGYLNDKKSSGEFLEEKIIYRDIEEDVQEFIERSDKIGCILMGQSGMGKTHIVCSQVSHYLERDFPVLAYSGRIQEFGDQTGDVVSDINALIMSDLGLDPEISLINHLTHLNIELEAQNKTLLIFWDGIEKPFSPDPRIEPQHLLKTLDTLIQTWDHYKVRVKLLITCVTSVWDLLPTQDLVSWHLYFTKVPEKPLIIERFNNREFREAYYNYLGIHPDIDVDRFIGVEKTCEGDPFVLKLISELDAQVLEGGFNTAMVFDKYYQERILGRGYAPEKEHFLALFVKRLLEQGQEDIPDTLAIGLLDKAYRTFLEEGILIVNHSQGTVQLYHTRLTEYLIVQYLNREYPDGIRKEELYGLIRKAASGFHALWDATASYLARCGSSELFKQMAESEDYSVQEMLIFVLQVSLKEKTRTKQEIVVLLKALLRNDARESRVVGVRAALRLREVDGVLEELLDWIRKSPVVAAEHTYLAWRETKQTSPGAALWDEVAETLARAWNLFPARKLRSKWKILFPVLDFLEQLRIGLHPEKRVELKAVFDFILSLTWRLLVNEYRDSTTIERMSEIWDSALRRSQSDARLRVLWKNVEEALPEITEQRISKFANEVLPSTPPYLPSSGDILAKLLDPNVDLNLVEREATSILDLLQTGKLVPVALASLALSIQVHRDEARMESILRDLFKQSEPPEKLAILVGFALHDERNVQIRLVEILQDLTRQLLSKRPDYLTNPHDPWGKSQKYKISFVLAPIGFAWCNHQISMGEKGAAIEPISTLFRELAWSDNMGRLRGMLESLIPVGIYFPEAVLNTMLEMDVFDRPELHSTLTRTLGVIQAFNGESVVRFLRDHRLDIRASRPTWIDFDRFSNLFYWLSTVNFLYYSLHTSNLRPFWIGAVLALTGMEEKSELVKRFSDAILKLVYEKDYRLERILTQPVQNPELIIARIAGQSETDINRQKMNPDK